MVRDPVCGMTVDPNTTKFSSNYDGQLYYFCNKVCKTKFDNDHSTYIRRKGFFARFLNWVAKGNERTYHGRPPNCCDR